MVFAISIRMHYEVLIINGGYFVIIDPSIVGGHSRDQIWAQL